MVGIDVPGGTLGIQRDHLGGDVAGLVVPFVGFGGGGGDNLGLENRVHRPGLGLGRPSRSGRGSHFGYPQRVCGTGVRIDDCGGDEHLRCPQRIESQSVVLDV